MGVKSTHLIDREVAKQIILSKVYGASDEVLAELLECFPESEYRNYEVTSKEELEEDGKKQFPMLKIGSVSDFGEDQEAGY